MAFFDFLGGGDEGAKEIERATKKSLQFAQEGRDRATGVLSPAAQYGPIQSRLYDLAGLNGAQAQQSAFGQFSESPEFAFLRSQGEEAAQRAAAAGGQLASGRTLAALSRFGQGLASQSYGQYYDRLRDLYGTALGTAGSLAGIYGNSGNALANIQMQGGSQLANYKAQQGNVLSDLLSQGLAAGSYIYGNRSSYGE
jgi:hypothetical protein